MTLLRASVRHLARHPWQAGLSVLGIALGVAVVVSVDLASTSARRAFALAAEGVTGRATHQVVGGSAGLDERVMTRLAREVGVQPLAPVVEAWVGVEGMPGRTLQLLGVDPFSEAPFRPYLGRGAGEGTRAIGSLVTEPGAVILSRETAAEFGVEVSGTLGLRVSGRARPVRVVGLIEPSDARSRQALRGLVVADVATAQELLGRPGLLSRIDLVLPAGRRGEAILARVRAALSPGMEVVPAAARSEFVGELTRAFDVNLTALSLLALVVGLFLAYNTMTFSVVQRRATIGVLRALGVTRAEIVATVLAEALCLGLVATALGLGAGVVLAGGLVRLVTRTINDLYFVVVVRDLAVAPAGLARAAALGVGATLLAALVPAAEASAALPGAAIQRIALETRVRRAAPRAALLGVAALMAGALLIRLSGRSLGWSYAGLFAAILGAALLTPLAMVGAARAAGPLLGRLLGLPGHMAARGIVARLSRTGVAVAALMVAVAATVGVAVMIRSFRATVVRWLDTSLVADVYVSAPAISAGRGGESTLDPAVIARLREAPGVQAVGTYRGARVQSPSGPTQLVALGIGPGSYRQFRFLAGSPDAVWPAFQDDGAAIVSEPYAYRHGLTVGGAVRLRTDRGERAFPVVGVFADYGSDQGVVMVSRRTYEASWEDRGVSSLGLVLAPGVDPEAAVGTLRARAGGDQALLIRSNRALRESSLEIFDRTFAITAVLRVLATAVAVIGVLSALMALQLERARELGVLRAQGLTPREVGRLVLAETGLLGGIAGVLAVPVGIALALVLIHVINRRAFGWSIETTVPVDVLLEAVGLAVLAALAAGAYPAWRMARTPPAPALREE
ncbi:MAG TPA: FtsX-like permease family protein [Methylomirabilota bacterium]